MASEPLPSQGGASPSAQLITAPPAIVTAGPSDSIDSLQCQWVGCSDRAATAEQLYEHVCERHVGRKSTNNLNLTCQWGNCHTTTVKRDHITSHIRVHVPLKPHKCDFCGKSFKRPQDLKKHVKTHADESVLMRSPEPASGSRHHPNAGYANMNNQPRPQGYYPEAQLQPGIPMNYGFQGSGHNTNGHTQPGYYGPTAPSTSQSYGPVYYVNNGADHGNQASYGDRKMGAELVDNLIGSIKRHEFNPTSWPEISQRLMPFHNVQLPFPSGGGAMPEYQAGAATMAAPYQQAPSHPYSLPLPVLRTKQDLVDVEAYLNQMVTSAYDVSSSTPSAAHHQHPIHHHHQPHGLAVRTSNSPPGMHNNHMRGDHHAHSQSSPSHASTPELTPGSSHYSEHSPTSGVSPTEQSMSYPQHQQTGYPTLPNVSQSHANQAPTSTLGSTYDQDLRRRYSGGRLQKAAPAFPMKAESSSSDMDIDSPSTPTPSSRTHQSYERKSRTVSKTLIDPALRIDPALSGNGDGAMDTDSGSPGSTPRQGELDGGAEWVESMRLLETLRDLVRGRLERGEWMEDDGEEVKTEGGMAESLYPDLKV